MPSHHGHSTVAGVPVRFDTTRPVPRHARAGRRGRGILGRGVLVGHRGHGGYRRRTWAPTAASPPRPPGPCTWATCAPRCWPGCSRAQPVARFLVRVEDLDAGRVAPALRGRAARRPAPRSAWTGTAPVVRQSERGARYDAALARLDADGLLYPCWCTRRGDPRGRLGAPRRRCPRAPTPGPAARLTAAAARRARGRRAPAGAARRRRRRRSCASPTGSPGQRRGRGRRLRGPPQRRRRRLQPGGRRRRRRAGRRRGRARRRPARHDAAPAAGSPRALGLEPPAHAHVPLVLGARRRAPGQAPRRRDARRPRGARPVARRRPRASWPRSVGLAEPGERPSLDELAARFRSTALRRVPA